MAKDRHPEQDPAEGSRKTIEHELAEQDKDKRGDKSGTSGKPARDQSSGAQGKQA